MNDLLGLNRDQQTFVQTRKTAGLNWEDSLKKGEAYSSYILEDRTFTSNLQVLQAGYKLATSMISIITSQAVFVGLDPTENFATACKKIFLATEVMEDKSLTPFERIDVFCGAALHEGAHIEETDFDLLSYPDTTVGEIKHSICNVLEDERIETITADKHPGYGVFFGKTKYYYFDKQYREQKIDPSTLSVGQKLFNLFFSIVRYPKYIQTDDLVTFSKQVDELKKVLSPYPSTNEQIKQAVEKVYNILSAYYTKAEPKPKTLAPGGGGKTPLEKMKDELLPLAGLINKASLSASSRKETGDLAVGKVVSSNQTEVGLLEGRLQKGSVEGCYFNKASENQWAYEELKKEVAPYASTLAAILGQGYRSYDIIHQGERNGKLDTRRLVDARIGLQTIYTTKEYIQTQPLDIGLLVDLSGSMSGKKMMEAKKCAVLFNESLPKVRGINTYIYGHTADDSVEGSTDLYIYQEGKYRPRHAIGSMESKSNNRDGLAIEETAKRIRKHSSNQCILFVISDGRPNADAYKGAYAIEQTRESIKRVEKMGFVVIQIAIEPHVPSEQMFTHFVQLTNLATLPKDLGKVLTKIISKLRS